MERPPAAAAVVEDTVEHDAHAARMCLVEQLAQGVVATQQRVHGEVVVGVIAMIGGRGEHGVQVERRDAETLQAIEVLDDPVEVAALEAADRRRSVPGLELTGSRHAATASKPVGEDLVEDGVAHPGWSVDGHGAQGIAFGPRRPRRGTIEAMWQTVRAMPPGVLVFLGYSFVVLSVLGLSMPVVIDQAVQAPITFIGLVWMLLLAYLIFTMTLVLQRKQAAYMLSLGLTSLLLPLATVLLFAPAGWIISIAAVLLFIVVVWSLRRPRSREWFSEP